MQIDLFGFIERKKKKEIVISLETRNDLVKFAEIIEVNKEIKDKYEAFRNIMRENGYKFKVLDDGK